MSRSIHKILFAAIIASFVFVSDASATHHEEATGAAAAEVAADAAPAEPPAPADDSIRVVYADLDRYQQQADGLHSGQSGSAKRILKLLDQTEGRLESSPNKDDASYAAAEARLAALRAQLNAWLAQQ